MARRMALDDDTGMTRAMTNGLVTNTVGHDIFCIVCDDFHVYHQVLPSAPY